MRDFIKELLIARLPGKNDWSAIRGLLVDLYNMSALFYVLIGLFVIAIVTTLAYDRLLRTEKKLNIKLT